VIIETSDRLFLDTGFVQARFSRRDKYHTAALQLMNRVETCAELWTTEAVLLEIGSTFRAPPERVVVPEICQWLKRQPNRHLVTVSGDLLERGIALFSQRSDKAWSLTDCVSFVLMQDQQLTDALTCDHHFVQAGFRALLLEESESNS
jgi:predicted nucleic acid-binding protein